MKNKKIITGAAIIVLIIIAAVFLNSKKDQGYVMDKNRKIKLKDIQAYHNVIDYTSKTTKEMFSKFTINRNTLNFLMYLDGKFKECTTTDELFEKIHEYLISILPAEDAEKIFDLYKTFVRYQLSLGKKSKEWGMMPKTPEDAIAFLHKLQDYRREVFGIDTADALFGASIKSEEYPIRRGAILNDKKMYGADKEKKLADLNKDMWEDEAGSIDKQAEPYTLYREKLDMYQRDFSEMNETDKQAKIRQFREQYFSPEQVMRLDDVDRSVAEEKIREDKYFEKEKAIMNDPDIDQAEKDKRIQKLQDGHFGSQDEADAFRRRLNMQRATEEAMKKK
jgi:lipase chaperone LimK